MGAGCSSPLRRFGGKKSKQNKKDSSSTNAGDNDGAEQMSIAAKLQLKQQTKRDDQHNAQSGATELKDRLTFNVENEITIQSEAGEDHPSSASNYTDIKNQPEKVGATAADVDSRQSSKPNGSAAAVARIAGFGASIPYDRHLLVSPALSPAPSICQSPAPASPFVGCPLPLSLADLQEAFITLTFGPAASNGGPQQQQQQQSKSKIRPESGTAARSEFCNYYSKQLIQNREDLTDQISVLFIASDNALDGEMAPNRGGSSNVVSALESVANHVESCLRNACHEHSFKLRFLNLSHDHLARCLWVNNLQDAAMRILEEEYRENSQRIVVIILSNGIVNLGNGPAGGGGGGESASESALSKPIFSDKRLLPTKIDAQLMNKLLQETDESILGQKARELLKLWYNQTGSHVFHLRPIYSVNQKITSKLREEREQAWQGWLADADTMLRALISACGDGVAQQQQQQQPAAELLQSCLFKSLFSSYIDFITSEPQLQKRTLLIRNYSTVSYSASQTAAGVANPAAGEKLGLNDLARLLADPCKLTMKRNHLDEEFSKTASEWIGENFSKYIESFTEARISSGKYTPPFIERNLFIELTRQRHYLEHFLENVSENFLTKCHNFYTSQLESIFSKLSTAENLLESNSSDLSESKLSLVSQPSANHLIFLSGPRGCGKTTLLAQIIKLAARDLLNRAQIIYRFCGLTIDSLSSHRVLRSICEQFCQSQGENTTAASYIYSSRQGEIMEALNKTMRSRNVIIFLDGIEAFSDQTAEACLEWLCELEASPRIKIVMTVESNSELYRKVLNTYTDATHITLDNPTNSEWAQMLASTAKQQRFTTSANFYDELKKLSESSPQSSVTYKDAANVLHMRRLMTLNNDLAHAEMTTKMTQLSTLENLKSVHRVILNHLQYIIPPYLLCCLLVALETSRNGLSELEIIEAMELIWRKHPEAKQGVKLSWSLLSYLKVQLRPWLRVIVCDRSSVKLTVQADFSRESIDQFAPKVYPKIVSDVRESLLEYYSRPYGAQGKRGSRAGLVSFASIGGDSSMDGSPTRLLDKMSQAERAWMGTQASELMNLLILTNPSKAKNSFMSKNSFYLQFIHRSVPEEFVEDHDRLKAALTGQRKLSQNEELQHLVNFVRQSIFPLRYDGTQIYSQIYCRSYETYKSGRSSKSKKFNDILALASCPPIWSLLPVSETSIDSFIKTRIGPDQQQQQGPGLGAATDRAQDASNNTTSDSSPQQPTSQQKIPERSVLPSNQLRQPSGGGASAAPLSAYQQSSKQRIFTIKDNHRHVIAIYPDKNRLAVWDIFEEKAVRVIQDIDHPRDLRMIDQRRAVVLCNRELRVYDLDSGSLLTKLKGVMNQKMPYFETFGKDYVIALARNRMYVNMLNINTGELETTFKVGEDRFLNSLLVSAEGGICVCGDETQKPFPLLVWNLNERRLMYDLRMDRHEFITRMSAISDDGHFVVSVCKQLGDNNDHPSSAAGSAATSAGAAPQGAQKSTPNFIVIYDLNSGTLFKKWKPGLDTCAVAITLSTNRSGKLVNSLVDSSILVWDLTTGSKRHTLVGHSAPVDVIKVQNNRLFSMDSTCRDQSLRIWDIDEGYCLVVFSPDAPISCCQMSVGGDALVCSFSAETRLSTLVMCKNDTVNDVLKRNKRRKSSKSSYIFDEPASRKSSS